MTSIAAMYLLDITVNEKDVLSVRKVPQIGTHPTMLNTDQCAACSASPALLKNLRMQRLAPPFHNAAQCPCGFCVALSPITQLVTRVTRLDLAPTYVSATRIPLALSAYDHPHVVAHASELPT
jgi:hypothetical protein